jgi:hypothetical protein
MPTYAVTHAGGPVDNAVVGTSAVIVLAAEPRRRYAILTASRLNTEPVYLMLSPDHPKDTGAVIGDFSVLPEVEKGIPLYPGAAYEIDEHHNLFIGHVLGISAIADQVVLTQEGR